MNTRSLIYSLVNSKKVWITSLFAMGFILTASTVFALRDQTMTHEVAVQNNFYAPDDLTIGVGDRITWVNRSGFHNVESTSGPVAFTSGDVDLNWTFTFTFDTPGTYEYTCVFHSGMDGKVVVLPANSATATPVMTASATPILSGTATPTAVFTLTPFPTPTMTPEIRVQIERFLPMIANRGGFQEEK